MLLLEVPNANITEKLLSPTLHILLNRSNQLTYDWNQIGTEQFDGMTKSQETAKKKLRPSFEMPDNANKQGKDFSALFRC